MGKESRSPEQALKDLYGLNEITVDQRTAGRLEELCSTITDTYGLVEVILQLAIKDESQRRVAYMRTALDLSARGTKSIKMFLSEWSVLVEESKRRENSGRSARDSAMVQADLAATVNSLEALDPITKREPQLLAETERSAVLNTLQETQGNKKAASQLLGIGRTTLYRKLKEYKPIS